MTKRVQGSILLADSDDESSALVERLSGQGLDVEWVRSAEEGIARGNEGADLVISEFHFPDHSGLRLVRELQSKNPRLPIVIVSREAGSDAAIEAIKLGAYDFLTKPVQFEELMEGIERALEDSRRSTTPVEIGEVYPEQDTIVGKGRAMREIYKQLGRIAAQPVTVLVRGETGTGKELIARAIYQHGHRSHKPFIAVNCAAIPDSLLESELFGHEKGSFTGADRMRIGRFEQAHGGTLFLDEIGDLDGQLQVKLLRVLQEKAIQRVGSQADIPVDVRVIAATHRDLETMIQEGDFRQDLFYRLNVVSLQIPSLRERSEDIPALIDYFLSRYGREFGIESPSIAPKAVEFLQQQDWPGNIRQLQNVLRKALLATR
ncbi:MAG: sigma-54 dependent transcriptional regulator, partial [Verrucomicrobiota bacterium]